MRCGLAAVMFMVASMPAYGQRLAADHHQHLFSPALAALISPAPPAAPVAPITAADLITLLDAAGIRRAAIFSTAYIFEQPTRKVDKAHDKVRADNDWTSQQVAQYPDRLVLLCHFVSHTPAGKHAAAANLASGASARGSGKRSQG